MARYDYARTGTAGARTAQIDQGLRAHMNKVYGLMSGGMVMTALAAWAISGIATTSDPSQAAVQIGASTYLTSFGAAIYMSPLKWVIMFAPLLMVFGFGAVAARLSAAAGQLYFQAYAALMGLSISSIFLVFTGYSIVQTFLVTAITFGALSLYGYTTKRDLSAMGTFLFMGLIGLIVASVVNIFLASPAMTFAISVIGVLIFAGLTAYDTQSIKSEYVAHAAGGDQEWLDKSATMGALRLYLDFLNLFMFLLQFLGSQRE
jgi:FtsH-binding integral membrane protein